MNLLHRTRSGLLKVVGYLIPLIQSLPSLGAWTGLMTVPFATFLIMFFTNLPTSFDDVMYAFFSPFPFLFLERTFIIVGLSLLVYSLVYLWAKREKGLVTSGPYRLIRHPQYFGIILLTLGFTSWSVWILSNTFGAGFLSKSQTMLVWFIELLAYIFLACIEELFLSRNFGEAFEDYRSQVPFFIPFFKTNRKYLDFPVSISIPTILLFILINIQNLTTWFLL